MKRISIAITALILSTATLRCQSKQETLMDESIKNVLQSFTTSVGSRNVETLDKLLHKDFRVIANRFNGADQTVILPKTVYLGMMKEGKIGGTSYDLKILKSSVFQHTAMVEVNLTESKSTYMHVYFVLIQNGEDEWEIVSDTPIVVSN